MEVTTDFAIEYLLDDCDDCPENKDGVCITQSHCFNVKQMAIKALEQEPCGDAVSRQSAISLADDLKQDLPDDEHIADMVMAHNEGILEYQTQLSLLSPVTPQPKTGHWIDMGDFEKCSACNGTHLKEFQNFYGKAIWVKTNYCHNCGAKMVEPQESEVQE